MFTYGCCRNKNKAGLMHISPVCRNKESWFNVDIWLFVGTSKFLSNVCIYRVFCWNKQGWYYVICFFVVRNKAGLMYITGWFRNKQGCIYLVVLGTKSWSKVGANKACQIYLSGCLSKQTRLVWCKYLVVVGTSKAGLIYIFGCCRNKKGWSNVYIWML